jgi:hypothetical protein
MLARHHKMCKFANWFHPSNITFCSRAPGHATEEQSKQPNINMQVVSNTYLPYRCPGKRTLIDIHPMLQVTIKSVLRKSDPFGLHIL